MADLRALLGDKYDDVIEKVLEAIARETDYLGCGCCTGYDYDEAVKRTGHDDRAYMAAHDALAAVAMLAKLDATHAHTCEPVWRPTTRDEIQPGWELRSRRSDGFEATWGIAYHRDSDGDWYTEAGRLLTFADAGWTVETTAPLPEPEPWDEALVRAAVAVMADAEAESDDREDEARAVLNLLADRGLIERPKAGA